MKEGITYKEKYYKLIDKIKADMKERDQSVELAKKVLEDSNIMISVNQSEVKESIEINDNVALALSNLLCYMEEY